MRVALDGRAGFDGVAAIKKHPRYSRFAGALADVAGGIIFWR